MQNNLTSKQKIDQMLGISSEDTIDTFLDKLSTNQAEVQETVNGSMHDISDKISDSMAKIDSGITEIQNNNIIAPQVMVDLNSSMKEVEDLIELSKSMFKHVYEAITTTDLVDSELVQAASKLLESIHININEFITLYRDKQKYIDKIRLKVLDQEHKKELLELKHKYEIEKIQAKLDNDATDITNDSVAYNVSDITKMLEKSGDFDNI